MTVIQKYFICLEALYTAKTAGFIAAIVKYVSMFYSRHNQHLKASEQLKTDCLIYEVYYFNIFYLANPRRRVEELLKY